MSEPHPKNDMIDGKSFAEIVLMEPSERTMGQRIAFVVHERQTNLDLCLNPNSSLSQLMDQTDPSIRPKTIELYQAEITALQALDPNTATIDDVVQINDTYQPQRDALVTSR